MNIPFLSLKSWFLQNQTTKQIMQGRFAPVNLTMNIKPNYATHTALSRTKEIVQFLNQSADTLSFRIVMHDYDAFTGTTETDFELLKSWAKPDVLYGNKPPILTFWVGQGWAMMDCIIDGLSDIQYEDPTIMGSIRGLSLTINLRAYAPFSLTGGALFETRYHRAVVRDYYELIAWREYNNPMLGVTIRNRHPTISNIQVGDTIRLPSVEAIRKEKAQPTSIAFITMLGKKSTPQKLLRESIFTRHNVTHTSHVLIG
jgi:hypothetical protein